MSLLPRLTRDQSSSSATGVNDWGVIIGGTTQLQPQYRSTATLWLGNHVVELDSLVRADDPLKACANDLLHEPVRPLIPPA